MPVMDVCIPQELTTVYPLLNGLYTRGIGTGEDSIFSFSVQVSDPILSHTLNAGHTHMLHGSLECMGHWSTTAPLGILLFLISSRAASSSPCLVLSQLYTTPSLVRWLAFRTEGEEQMGTRGLITILTESVLQSFVSAQIPLVKKRHQFYS
jgi:hypothetical protein